MSVQRIYEDLLPAADMGLLLRFKRVHTWREIDELRRITGWRSKHRRRFVALTEARPALPSHENAVTARVDIARLLGLCTTPQRVALKLRAQGMTAPEVAAHLGIEVRAVRARQFAGIHRIRLALCGN